MTRYLSAALLLGFLTVASAQDQKPEPVKISNKTCGTYTVRLAENGFDDPLDTISLIKNGKTYTTLSDELVDMQQCGDITGDGVPEVVLMQFSGGAHCCATHEIWSLTTPPRRILHTFTGHGDGIDIQQLDGKGAKEVINGDWRFAYAYGMSFADSPALPRIYSYIGGQYVENTRAFPGVLLGNIWTPDLKDYWSGGALESYASYILAGKPAQADAYLTTLPQEDRAWLDNYAPDIRQRMSSAGLEDWPQRAGVGDEDSTFGIGGAFSRAGAREYLSIVKEQGNRATLRLYRDENGKIVSSPALATFNLPAGSSFGDLRWWPGFTVRRASGRDDAVMLNTTSGNLRYPVYRVGPQSATPLTNDPLAVAAGLLADLSSVAKQVNDKYGYHEKPLTAAQTADVDRRIAAAATRAAPWAKLSASKLDLPRLGLFNVNAIEVSRENAQSALVAGTLDIASVKPDEEYPLGNSERYTFAIFLENRSGTWAVTNWQLTPRTGEFPMGK